MQRVHYWSLGMCVLVMLIFTAPVQPQTEQSTTLLQQRIAKLEQKIAQQERIIASDPNRELVAMLTQAYEGTKIANDRLVARSEDCRKRLDNIMQGNKAFIQDMELEDIRKDHVFTGPELVKKYESAMDQLGRCVTEGTRLSISMGQDPIPTTPPSSPAPERKTKPRLPRPALDQAVARR